MISFATLRLAGGSMVGVLCLTACGRSGLDLPDEQEPPAPNGPTAEPPEEPPEDSEEAELERCIELGETCTDAVECCSGNCESGTCDVSPCPPGEVTQLASGAQPRSLAMHEGFLYWGDVGSGEVRRMDSTGGEAELLHQGQYPGDMLVAGEHLYWIDVEELGGSVRRMPLGGGSAELLANPEHPWDMTADATHLYWTNVGTDDVMRMPQAGGPTEVLAEGDGAWGDIAVNETHAFWSALQGTLHRVPKSGGPAELFDTSGLYSPVVSGGFLFALDYNSVVRIDLATGSQEYVANPPPGCGEGSLVVDGTAAYWTNWIHGWSNSETAEVCRANLDGSHAAPLVTHPSGDYVMADGVAVDDLCLYWARYQPQGGGPGGIYRTSKYPKR